MTLLSPSTCSDLPAPMDVGQGCERPCLIASFVPYKIVEGLKEISNYHFQLSNPHKIAHSFGERAIHLESNPNSSKTPSKWHHKSG